jgi:hypothetical protein
MTASGAADAREVAESAANSRPMGWLARIGLTARGLVYIVVGWLAVLVGLGGRANIGLRRLNCTAYTPRGVATMVAFEGLLVWVGVAAKSPVQTVIWLSAAVALIPSSEWMLWRSWRRTRHLTVQPWHYEVSGSKVSVTTPATVASSSWSEFSKVRTARHAWFFTAATSRAHITVPRAAFSPDAQRGIGALVTPHVPSLRATPWR